MFNDGRSKRVVFVAHCFLNQNSISDGTAVYPAAFKDLVGFFLNADIGIVQMPCPELCCLGLDRGNIHGADSPVVVENTRIRKEMKEDGANRKLAKLADYVDTTSDRNEEISGMGLFIEEISSRLSNMDITIPMIGLKGNDNIIERLQQLL